MHTHILIIIIIMVIYIYTCYVRGSRLSNTSCLTRAFFKRCE